MKEKSFASLPVFLVDDETTVLHATAAMLHSAGVANIQLLDDSRELLSTLERQAASALLLDLMMPHVTGSKLLPEIVHLYPELPVIVMTAAQDVETAVRSMKEGAFDYLVKPVDESRLLASVRHALEVHSLRRQMGVLKRYLLSDCLENDDAFAGIVTHSRKMRAIFQYLEAVAASAEPVLISGETGAGKEMFALALHKLSGLNGQFIQVNVAGLDDTLFSDTLFGHKKGAFTGADQARPGLIAQAAGGTLFLDEIGDLSMASQVKLLRLLQEHMYFPLGSDVARPSDARVVCATNCNLAQMMRQNQFRSDLFFRLSVHQIEVPPLRQHKEDIPLLLQHFLDDAAAAINKPAPAPSNELITLLSNYHFPGNVRELRAMVFNAMALHRGGPVLAMDSFRQAIQKHQKVAADLPLVAAEGMPVMIPGRFPTLDEVDEAMIKEALRRAKGNQGVAATLLGLSRPALNRRLSRRAMRNDS
ncbi:MAG TPA: sigma-54 dependent transcriptional regulator [Accumulibacter sp.]|jgi:DNA-binding NtrC family response regulator|nr:sigma-54 dependent transcriptional regulator [Accumulibacter sp.]HQC79785.1 sigma-54 dependent transcriptional regulator [Accumulibacter sp.]